MVQRILFCVTGILEALQWQANHNDEEIMAKREEVMAALEFAAAEQKSSGLLEAWFGNCAKHIREVRGPPFYFAACALGRVFVAGGG